MNMYIFKQQTLHRERFLSLNSMQRDLFRLERDCIFKFLNYMQFTYFLIFPDFIFFFNSDHPLTRHTSE